MSARVMSINVGRPAQLSTGRRVVPSAIVKAPVSGPVAARGTNLTGDEQADKEHHGGPDQAVYAYASEDAAFWSEQIGRELAPASFGENLTLAGVDVSGARIGERWRIGTAELRVAGPRIPCFKLEARIGVPGFQRRFLHGGRPGAYLAISAEGELQAGDAVEVVYRPDHEVSVALVLEALLLDRSRVVELEPARGDMLPKLAGWFDELAAANASAHAARRTG
jgi:MOSC domain-containing protein YiiM